MKTNSTSYDFMSYARAGRSNTVANRLRTNGGLEKAVCGFDDIKGIPKHSKEVPPEVKGALPYFYCFDSRGPKECPYSESIGNRPFCTYK